MDDVNSLQRGSGTEPDFFQSIAVHGPGGGRPNTSQQGIYCFAPSGEVLSADNTRDAARAAACLRRGLARWKELSKAERLGPERGEETEGRWTGADLRPVDGLILRGWSRDLGPEKRPLGEIENPLNTDMVWFRAEEAKSLVPEARKGAKRSVPERLARRLARLHFVDNVMGQTFAFQDGSVEEAEMAVEVTGASEREVTIRITGRTKASHEQLTLELEVLGTATWDRQKERFAAFEMVVAGTRTGLARNARPGLSHGPAPIGYVFQLATDEPYDRAPPAFIGGYGWR